MPVVPISRHCSDSLQLPGVLPPATLFPPTQGFELTVSKPPVSRTWPVSNKGAPPFRITWAGLFVQVAVLANAPVLQLLKGLLVASSTSKSLLSKFSPLVWTKIALWPGRRRIPPPIKAAQRL